MYRISRIYKITYIVDSATKVFDVAGHAVVDGAIVVDGTEVAEDGVVLVDSTKVVDGAEVLDVRVIGEGHARINDKCNTSINKQTAY